MAAPEPQPPSPLPWRTMLTVLLVMTLCVSLIWAAIDRVDDTDVPEDDATPAPSTMAASPPPPPDDGTPPSTPVIEAPEWPVGSLPSMLGLAPDRLADGTLPLNDVARYANIAAWMEAAGLATPASTTDPSLPAWQAQLDHLALPSSLRERGLDPAWERAYGFTLLDVEQVLVIGQAPDYVTIMRGSFDQETLQAAWVASGYQPVEVEGTTIWSLYPDDAIDLSDPESRPGMGTLNNIVMLEDGTVLAAARISRLGSTLRVIHDDAASLAENEAMAPLLRPSTGVAGLASAIIDKGSLLQATDESMLEVEGTPIGVADTLAAMGTPESDPEMPEVRLVLVGLPLSSSAGPATPEADALPGLTVLLVVDGEDDARDARQSIRARLRDEHSPVTGQPYTARFEPRGVSVIDGDDASLVRVELGLVGGARDWLAIVADRDLGFAFWMP